MCANASWSCRYDANTHIPAHRHRVPPFSSVPACAHTVQLSSIRMLLDECMALHGPATIDTSTPVARRWRCSLLIFTQSHAGVATHAGSLPRSASAASHSAAEVYPFSGRPRYGPGTPLAGSSASLGSAVARGRRPSGVSA